MTAETKTPKVKAQSATQEQLDRIRQELKSMPDRPPGRMYNATKMVLFLKDDIQDMRQREYTFKEIADVIQTQGVKISPDTLKNYFQKLKASGKESSSETKPPRKKAASSNPQATSPATKAEVETLPSVSDPEPEATDPQPAFDRDGGIAAKLLVLQGQGSHLNR